MLEAIDLARVQNSKSRDERADDIEGLWKPIYRHLGGPSRNVMTLTEVEIERYEGARRQEKNRRGGYVVGQTIRREVQAIKRSVIRAVRDRKLHRSPIDWPSLAKIESDPINAKQASKGWSPAEVDLILSHLSAKALRAKMLDRMQAIQISGLRLHELARYERSTWLRGADLHVPAIGKNGKPRVIYLSKSGSKLFKRYDDFKIGKPNKALKLASKRAGFVDRVLTPRDLRAHFISKVAKRNLKAAQELAGHKNIATTSRYIHLEEEQVRKVSRSASVVSKRGAPKGARASRSRKK